MAGMKNRASKVVECGTYVPTKKGEIWVRPGVTDEQQRRLVEIVVKLLSGQKIDDSDEEFIESLESPPPPPPPDNPQARSLRGRAARSI